MMKEVSAGKQAGEERFVHFHLLRDRRVSAVGEDEQAISARLAR
jgi:hypothetical protein